MNESVFLTTILYAFYFIVLEIFEILLDFLVILYRRKHEIDKIYFFILLLLLYIFYPKEFSDPLLLDLFDLAKATNIALPFEKFYFESLPKIKNCLFKLI